MALKSFCIYAGIFFACAIILIILVKTYARGFAQSGRGPYIYGFLSSLIAAAAAFLLSYLTNNLFLVFWYTGIMFLVFGAIHVAYVRKKYFQSYGRRLASNFGGEVLFGLSLMFFVIAVFSVLEYFVVKDNKTYPFYPMVLSTLAFFVPMLVLKTFEAAYAIPAAMHNTWVYPLHEEIEYPEENDEKLLVVHYQIAKKASDLSKVAFIGKAPPGMKFGEAYYHFLNDYNDSQQEPAIQFSNSDFEPHEWWFYKEVKWYQRQHVLDPGLSVRENGIRQNSVIVCERMQHFIQE